MRSRTNTPLLVALWAVSIGWLAFLIGMSSQNGQETAQTSVRVARLVMWLLGIAPAKLAPVNQALRTLAHFGCFFILGGAVCAAVQVTWPNRPHSATAVAALCSMIAVLDEVKKVFISGRHLSWPEAGLNVLGVLCGVALLQGIRWLAARGKASRGA